MNRATGMDATEMELMRLLHGELPPGRERELRDRMKREPGLAAAMARLERTWSRLELPPPVPVPAGFAGRIAARAREEAEAVSWASAPGWVRGAAAAALAAGIALGAGAGNWTGGRTSSAGIPERTSSVTSGEPSDLRFDDDLAESYWTALGELDEPDGGEP